MDCLGRTKPVWQLRRCHKPAKILFCRQHRFQPLILIFTISTIVGLYAGIWQDLVKPLFQSFASKNETPHDISSQPFAENDSAFKVLILPFDPLEDCSTQESDLAKAIYKRLVSLKEQDTLDISVKYETTQACPATFAEGKSIGNDFNADLVIWGETYEKCLLDTAKACLKYVILKEAKYNIERVGSTGIQSFASMAEITQGYLQKDIDYIIYWTLGLESFTQKNPTAALRYFEKIEADFSEQYEELFTYLGIIYLQLKQYDKGIDALEAAINIKPDDAGAHYNYAYLLSRMKNYNEARKHYTESLRISPDFAAAHSNYAVLLVNHFQEYDGAKKHFIETLQIKPDDEHFHYNYATLLQQHLKDYKRAKKHYREALNINPKYLEARSNYAVLLMDHFQDYDGARQHCLEALKINPNNALAHYIYAVLLNDLKDFKGARTHYREALHINPDFAEAHINYANLLIKHFQDYDEAKLHCFEALRINPDYGNAHVTYAVLLAQHLKDHNGAKKHFTEALRIRPDDAGAHNNYAALLVLLKDYDGAKKHFTEALRIRPDDAGTHYNYAILLKDLKDYDGAKKHYLRACELDSTQRNQKADEIFGVAAE